MPDIFNASNQKSGVTETNSDKKTDKSRPSSPKKTDSQHKRTTKKPHVDEYSETLRKEKPARNPLQAFAAKPLKTEFDSQMQGEEIVLMLRRHPITLVKPILISVLIFLAPFLFFSSPLLSFLNSKLKTAVIIGWYMLLTSFVLESFLIWFFNVFIVTDERIIDVDFSSLIYKNVSSAKIENIEDITVATGGVVASIIDYGTVFIQTSAEVPELEFEKVPNPNKVARVLNELMLEEEREKLEGRVR